jgi:proteasome assembly chaperone (PAC2) family protein
MSYRLDVEPNLQNPDLIVGWPGIGNVGVLAVETLRRQLEAEYLGEIEPEPFFYPSGVVIKKGILEALNFPGSRFYFKKMPQRDLILFIGEEQPAETGSTYASGSKAYQMAGLVLDVAQKFGCRRVFTSGAAVSAIHHNYTPGVWAVAANAQLLAEIEERRGNRFRSELQGRDAQANISGLNGLLVGVADRRGIPAACLMGEVPDYLARAPMPYPSAARSVLEVLARLYDLKLDFTELEEMRAQMGDVVEQVFSQFPDEIKEKISQRAQMRPEADGGEAITEEDKNWMAEHVEDLFRPAGGGNDRAA